MPNLSVIGAQWGDEGKGKVVDFYTESADVVVRFGGGANAGHTLVVGDKRFAVHLIPSGVIRERPICVLGGGMVIDPESLLRELEQLRIAGISVSPKRLRISARAHLVLPYHRLLDQLRDSGPDAIGTTHRGIGPAYEDKAARCGVRVADLLRPERLKRRLGAALDRAAPSIVALGGEPPALDSLLSALHSQADVLGPYVADTSALLADAIANDQSILFEGAQGALLDLDHGTYPYVTSSTVLPGGACAGAGVGPQALGEMIGVTKAYVTRVGAGPMPTELTGELGEELRTRGGEVGVTTGRPRRCGWLDLPALRYAVRISGIRWLALTKLDVLGGMDSIRVCEAYRLGDSVLRTFPQDPDDLGEVEPIYREVAGFEPFDGQLDDESQLPNGARDYLRLIEEEVGVRVCMLSTGPGREQTLVRHPF